MGTQVYPHGKNPFSTKYLPKKYISECSSSSGPDRHHNSSLPIRIPELASSYDAIAQEAVRKSSPNTERKNAIKHELKEAGIQTEQFQKSTLDNINKMLPILNLGTDSDSSERNKSKYNTDKRYKRTQQQYLKMLERLAFGDLLEYEQLAYKAGQAFQGDTSIQYQHLHDNCNSTYRHFVYKFSGWVREVGIKVTQDMEAYDLQALYNAVCRLFGCRLADTYAAMERAAQLAKHMVVRDIQHFAHGITDNNRFHALDADTSTVVDQLLAETMLKDDFILDGIVFRHHIAVSQVKNLYALASEMEKLQVLANVEDTENAIIHMANIARILSDAFPGKTLQISGSAGPTQGSLSATIPLKNAPLEMTRTQIGNLLGEHFQNMKEVKSNDMAQGIDYDRVVNDAGDLVYVHTTADNFVEAYQLYNDENYHCCILRKVNSFKATVGQVETQLEGVGYAKYEYRCGKLYEKGFKNNSGEEFHEPLDKTPKLPIYGVSKRNEVLPEMRKKPIRMKLTKSARKTYRQLKSDIEANISYRGRYNDMLHSYRGEGERILTNSFVAERMSVGCAHYVFGMTKTIPDNLHSYTMPSMSLLSVLAAVAACHSSAGIKILYWTRYEKTKIEERQLSLAHVLLPEEQTSRVIDGNPSYVRVYTNNGMLWDTIVTLG